MSLINDALKRASNNKRREAGNGPALPPTFEERRAASLIPVLLIIIVLAAAGYGGWMWYSKKNAAATAGNTNAVTRAGTAPASATTNNNPIARAQATLSKVTARNDIEGTNTPPAFPGAGAASTPNAAPTPAPTTTAAKSSPASPGVTIPGLSTTEAQLQAIYYRLKDPSVLINGRTLKQGQTVDGIKIIKIERSAVTIEQNGNTRVLTLK